MKKKLRNRRESALEYLIVECRLLRLLSIVDMSSGYLRVFVARHSYFSWDKS